MCGDINYYYIAFLLSYMQPGQLLELLLYRLVLQYHRLSIMQSKPTQSDH